MSAEASYNIRLLRLRSQQEVAEALGRLGVDDDGINIMSSKGVFLNLYLEGLDVRAANILKQDALSIGAEAALSRDASRLAVDRTDCLLMGSTKQLRRLAVKLRRQPFGLKRLGQELRYFLESLAAGGARVLPCRDRELELGRRTLVMGILNLTPDSFSDGGRYHEPEAALQRARQLVAEGADLIDVGAESTRPGATAIGVEEEKRRLGPVLSRLVAELPVPISVDTYKAETARWALEQGAHLINDVWGLKKEPELAAAAAQYGAALVLMHNQEGNHYQDLMGELMASLRQSLEQALRHGVTREKVVLDPGIGFGKDTGQNLVVLRRLEEVRSLGQPLLLGTSRKSVIGNTLGLPVDQRLEGTAATVALGVAAGIDLVRVHDVGAMQRVVRMADAIVRNSGV